MALFKANSQYLLSHFLERGLSATEAARQAGLSVDLICKLLHGGERPIRLSTAGRLQKAFGAEAVVKLSKEVGTYDAS